MKNQKNFGLQAGAYFNASSCHFHVLILKKQALSVSHLTVTLLMIPNNRRLVSFIGFVHERLILQWVCYSPDEEIDRDVTCWIIAAICLSFLRLELYSPLAYSISK
jgi:hypothetical protein